MTLKNRAVAVTWVYCTSKVFDGREDEHHEGFDENALCVLGSYAAVLEEEVAHLEEEDEATGYELVVVLD